MPALGCPQKDGSTKPLIESNVICDYLVDIYPQQAPLYPADPYEKARMRAWADFVGSRVISAFHWFLQHTEKSPYSLDEARKEFFGHLKTWIKEADERGPYFGGKDFMMAGVALAPRAVRLWILDRFRTEALAMPEPGEGGEDGKTWQRWRNWVEAVSQRQSIQNTLSDKEYYLPIYQQSAEDRAQSELAKAIRAGRGVP